MELEDLEMSDHDVSDSESENSSGHDADVEDEDFVLEDTRRRTTQPVRKLIEQMYANHYENARNTLPRGPAYLPHILHRLKHD